MVDPKLHWEQVYRTKSPMEVSWYRPHLETSLELIEGTGAARDAAIVDIGAGESTLVDDLLARGYRNLFAMDLSSTALEVAMARLGADAARINWLCGDVRSFPFDRHRFDVWHDRAVFHFLTGADDRAAYVRQVAHAVKPGGHVIVATFGPEGPAKCSGLDVMRYGPEALHDEFGSAFRLVEHRTELHRTPMGATQQFTYCYCRVTEPSGR
jgi:2-polyprenyl-3-methyl-5-hydroxy-6-metoxy-1,4-benzoquinol methylase